MENACIGAHNANSLYLVLKGRQLVNGKISQYSTEEGLNLVTVK